MKHKPAVGIAAAALLLVALDLRLGVTAVRPTPADEHNRAYAAIAHAPLPVQLHLATLGVAIACTVVLLAGVKGSRLHRTLGWTWSAAMLGTAGATLFIPPSPGAANIFGLGYLHLFALFTFISVPRAVMAAGGIMQGARGGIDIPDDDVDRVKNHLAKYYRKMDRTPPWKD